MKSELQPKRWQVCAWPCLLAVVAITYLCIRREPHTVPVHVLRALDRCHSLDLKPGPSSTFHKRAVSDRFQSGTKPTVRRMSNQSVDTLMSLQLLLNARVWTGEKDGTEVIHADILLDQGIIKGIGHVARDLSRQLENLVVVDVNGSWVTPGIVDMHSHLGDSSSPELEGSGDDNSMKSPVVPWMRSLDGLNTHDDAYALSIAGGVTTSLILPGSADAIGVYHLTNALSKPLTVQQAVKDSR